MDDDDLMFLIKMFFDVEAIFFKINIYKIRKFKKLLIAFESTNEWNIYHIKPINQSMGFIKYLITNSCLCPKKFFLEQKSK